MTARWQGGAGEEAMGEIGSLARGLEEWADRHCPGPVAATLTNIAAAAGKISELVAQGPLGGTPGAAVGRNTDGDAQKELDLRAQDILLTALVRSPVAVVASEELEGPATLRGEAPLAVAIDPLDGSSNIDVNLSIGTIFSILPDPGGPAGAAFLQPGANQLAAGFVVYGPQTTLAFTAGRGTHLFTFDRRSGGFVLTCPDLQIPRGRREYAINASNYRHWDEPVRAYIDDCMSGADGPRGENFNMRWIASLVAEAWRILARGGIFLYPRDRRPGYESGRLRLIYEANPIAFVVEQAGGAATDGAQRILDVLPEALHQRVPLVFGSADKVDRVARYHQGAHGLSERSPLFGRRGLFRA
jgi:fructose-1,6-bisphosphatase I